ncbi:hypothetical protein [Pedobacter paludis]|uniref:Uncharacterized protein n=1 Tax=Pedobacter paludis TaxID=2203212 RepID=A0A317F099_9SPHI|nr:hypothetical protein [Pedobacter paludis]PWS32670.1 hypothetical protein DF947_06255 [Pedobacter paludis]
MFRKIRSKDQPGLGVAVMELFGSKIQTAGFRFRGFCQRHPKKIYTLMVFLMASSLILCFSIMRLEDPVYTKSVTSPMKATGDPTAGIGLTIDKLQRVMALQAELQSLSKKENLTPQDSLRFAQMLSEIRQLTSSKK